MQPQTTQPQTMQPQTMQPQTMQPQTMQPTAQTIQPQTVQPSMAQTMQSLISAMIAPATTPSTQINSLIVEKFGDILSQSDLNNVSKIEESAQKLLADAKKITNNPQLVSELENESKRLSNHARSIIAKGLIDKQIIDTQVNKDAPPLKVDALYVESLKQLFETQLHKIFTTYLNEAVNQNMNNTLTTELLTKLNESRKYLDELDIATQKISAAREFYNNNQIELAKQMLEEANQMQNNVYNKIVNNNLTELDELRASANNIIEKSKLVPMKIVDSTMPPTMPSMPTTMPSMPTTMPPTMPSMPTTMPSMPFVSTNKHIKKVNNNSDISTNKVPNSTDDTLLNDSTELDNARQFKSYYDVNTTNDNIICNQSVNNTKYLNEYPSRSYDTVNNDQYYNTNFESYITSNIKPYDSRNSSDNTVGWKLTESPDYAKVPSSDIVSIYNFQPKEDKKVINTQVPTGYTLNKTLGQTLTPNVV